MQDKLIVNLSSEEEIRATVPDINYIPAYKVAEEQRRSNELERIVNENEREAYYEDMIEKVENDYFKGEKGDKGDKGDIGLSNTLTIGTVVKGDNAEATLTGESPNQILNLTLPKGDKGEQGIQGIQGIQGPKGPKGDKGDAFKYSDFTQEQLEGLRGPQGIQGVRGPQGATGATGPQGEKGDTGNIGPANTLTIGEVSKGDNAEATITGEAPNQTLNLVLPKGDAFTYEDFTEEQLEGLTGPQGEDYIITDDDYNSIAGKVEENIQPILEGVIEKSDNAINNSEIAINISKGANQSLSYPDYSEMITVFNSLDKDKYKVGQNILIVTLNVPDLWIFEIAYENAPYEYIDDESFENELKTNGYVRVGYYVLSALETQKVDLTNYIKKTDYASISKAGVVKVSSTYGTEVSTSGVVAVRPAKKSNIDNRKEEANPELTFTTNTRNPIVPATLDYAVKSVVGGHVTLTQTDYDTLVSTGTVTTEDGKTYTFDENTYYYIVEE